MKQLLQEMNWFLRRKMYVAMLSLTAACSYGFAVTHYSIGIDDTAIELYLKDGLAVVVGRWVMYLLNKLFYFGEFAPFITEAAGVLFLMLAATLFAILMRRVSGERAGIAVCTVSACVFVSNPMIGMVFTYYFHNGVGFGYVLTALALLCYQGAMEKKGRERLLPLLRSMLCIWAAAGCYESFYILSILGILVIVFLQGIFDRVKLNAAYVLSHLGTGAVLLLGSLALRSLVCALLIAIFRIEIPGNQFAMRSPFAVLDLFQGSEGWPGFFMLVKRFGVVYHLNALVYLPVTGYELACLCVGIYAAVAAIRKKNAWYLILFAGMLFTPFLLVLMENKITLYRSCQYLPFFTAVGIFLLYLAFGKWKYGRFWRYAVMAWGGILVFNQASMLNRDFYVDYREYELAKETLTGIAYDVERRYGRTTPIVLVGNYEYPYEFTKYYYVSYDSWQYRTIAGITDLVDEHLKEKYFRPEGYCFIGERNLPMIRWGFEAFDGTNRELIRFLEMHGHSFTTITDKEELKKAREMGEAMPGWPREGSIALQDGYVLIRIDH